MTNYQASTMLPLTTERLVLRRLIDADAPALAAYRNDPEVARYQTWERCSLAEAKALITEYKNQSFGNPGEWIQAAIVLRGKQPTRRRCSDETAASRSAPGSRRFHRRSWLSAAGLRK